MKLTTTLLLVAAVLLSSACGDSDRALTATPVPDQLPTTSQELIDAIVLHESDFDADLVLDLDRKTSVDAASAQLRSRGEEVVPQLIELARLAVMSTAHESETGWNAVRVLISIGEPAITNVRETERLPENLRAHIIDQIEGNGNTDE